MSESTSTDCRTANGIATGLLDGIISNLRVLNKHYADQMDTPEVQAALKDLAEDEDFLTLVGKAVKFSPKCGYCGNPSGFAGWRCADCGGL